MYPIFRFFSAAALKRTSSSVPLGDDDSSGGAIVTTSFSNCPKLAPNLLRYASAASSAFDNSFNVGVSFF